MNIPPTPLPSGIIIAATPLGNISDATPRLVAALGEAQVIASEDTRRTRTLAAALGVDIKAKMLSNHDHNEESRVAYLLDCARAGASVLVVSDAGMPSVSDPGFALIDAAHTAGIPVTCIPGPSAVPTALALSGLPVGRFCFEGFAPRKTGARRTWLEELKTEKRAVCFFESPHRLADTLAVAAEILGPDRRAAVCRELTKTYEEVKRGFLAELVQWAAEGVRGEITVVIEGAQKGAAAVPTDALVSDVEALVAGGQRLKHACAEIATKHGVSKRELYTAVLEQRS